MNFARTRKSLLFFCLLASALVHVAAIWLLYAHPVQMAQVQKKTILKPAPAPRLIPKDPEVLLIEKMENALEQSLNEVVAIARARTPAEQMQQEEGKHEMISSNRKHRKSWVTLPPLQEEALPPCEGEGACFAATLPPLFDPEMEAFYSSFALEDELEELPKGFETTLKPSIKIDELASSAYSPLGELIRDDYTLTDDQFSPTALSASNQEKLFAHFFSSLQELQSLTAEDTEQREPMAPFTPPAENATPLLVLPSAVDMLRNQWIQRSLAEQKLPSLADYGIEALSQNLDVCEELDVDVKIMNDPDNNRYIFSLTLHPHFESECKPLSQNFYFLIDRSNSIEPQKFARFKRAVQRSLSALHDDDRFNICIFDKKVVKLSDEPLPVSERTLQMAAEFLENEKSKVRFAANDLFDSLEAILPKQRKPDEMHSVILITDGKTLLSADKQKEELTKWASKQDSPFQFYTAAAGKGNNLVMLDLLSYVTGGKLLYSDTNAGLPRKLVSLIKELHQPIAKNVSVEIAAKDTRAHVTLLPETQKLPPLFAGQSYEIVGTLDEMCDLTLYLQGQNHDRWINIKKVISFENAEVGGRTLEKVWALTQSKVCYENFLKNGKNSYLKEAKEVVSPYNGVISME